METLNNQADKLVSIIIPAYNVENYIDECLNSIMLQTYSKWEAIIVDDGSTKVCLRRGSNPGVITSITFLNNNFLAINNINRTIHIFDLDIILFSLFQNFHPFLSLSHQIFCQD